MLRFAFGFAAATLLFHQLASLPSPAWFTLQALGLLLFAVIGVYAWLSRRRFLKVASFFGFSVLLAFTWSHAYALLAQPPTLLLDKPRTDIALTGTVIGLPQVRDQLNRFFLEASALKVGQDTYPGNWRLRLTWRDARSLNPGDQVAVNARIRAVHGYASPGAWDYEGWLYHQGVRYTGYVTSGEIVLSDEHHQCCMFDRLRAEIRQSLAEMPLSQFAAGVIRALVIADRSGLDASAKALFQATGTSHLMAVSGLHIGLVSGAVALLINLLWRRIPRLCERIPARLAATGLGLVAAIGYAGLAGFGLPTQRALIMFAVLAVSVLLRRESRAGHSLALAAVLVLLWHPPSIVAVGFWLSFGAVAAILASLGWTVGKPAWFRAVAVQAAVTVGLWPLLLMFGLPVSALSPLINLVVIPIFGLFIVPWSLLGALVATFAPGLAATGLRPMGMSLDYLHGLLDWAAANSVSLPSGTGIGVVAISIFVVLMVLPVGIPLRLVGMPLLLVPLLPRYPLVENGAFHVHLLDVGQGLSAVVETRRHVLVYDTGPRYPSGFSTAEAVVLPFLRGRQITSIDKLVASHGDNDHAGGIGNVMRSMPVAKLLSGEPARTGLQAEPCSAGQSWQWDGVRFLILHPGSAKRYSGNNASCVVRIENAAGAALLTGDIEATVERKLLRSQPTALNAALVVAPHHGSLSSSSEDFVAETGALHVVFARGWANRYGFPRPVVAERWTEAGAETHDTAIDGTVSFVFPAEGPVLGPQAYRQASKRFWTHDVGSAESAHAVSFGD